ncbi:Por secretion system C-terminal sorting domain-containing protein [Draconibacterium orientale]|uniref:Por secretion system C-terminal sorting domain-containing protein n=2 Tax=Draconibacterium orientale TaxID=1168034 RepID=A0A1I0JIT5_9BACT|nr:T9SS type A sorting domain-containing protein [Draconibacterium orientale]SEU09493.1 Por secretion system C-terminal sorting domain-containing protein [Draconibacterium orientale]
MKIRANIGNLGMLLFFSFSYFSVHGASNLINKEDGLNVPPVAQNDTFFLAAQYNLIFHGDVLVNDYDPNGDKIEILFAASPKEGSLTMDKDGHFRLEIPNKCDGTIRFDYYIKELTENEYSAAARVLIQIIENADLDDVPDYADQDNDNDGLPDFLDGIGLDTDNDGIPNNFDIDSDNDGITDNIEWQQEHNYIAPSGIDANKNGWDDAYDPEMGGTYYEPMDTDRDGIPDLTDTDSDNDGRSDLSEGFYSNTDDKAGIQLLHSDQDNDGLDNLFDLVIKGSNWQNSTASSSSPGDSNQNGIRDWRDNTSHISSQEAFIFPNPVAESFQFFLPEPEFDQQLTVQIYNIKGQLSKVYTTTYSNDRIPVQELTNGTYIISVNSDNFQHSQQITIQH